jgi:hypothetical protein
MELVSYLTWCYVIHSINHLTGSVTLSLVCVFITAGPITKLFACGKGGGNSGGHVLRETTSLDLCGLVCPSCTSGHWGEGNCVKEGGGVQEGAYIGGCYYATTLDIEVDPHRCWFGSCKSDFALQAAVECITVETDQFWVVAFQWSIHCCVEVTELSTNKQHTLSVSRSPCGPVEKEEAKIRCACGWF